MTFGEDRVAGEGRPGARLALASSTRIEGRPSRSLKARRWSIPSWRPARRKTSDDTR
jgi:hypothetical protein